MKIEDLALANYSYHLPDEKIAKYPLKDRSKSKLLYYHNGNITNSHFDEITNILPSHSLLVFNDTKVIPARIIFHKETGAKIEIFLLDPIAPSQIHETVMASRHECCWKVMIGNARKWKIGTSIHYTLDDHTSLTAYREGDDLVRFTWNSDVSFSEILSQTGHIPLPPYLNRAATKEDIPRYQTVYSRAEGAVAAPTAGLHFTSEILNSLKENGIATDYLTLHVSAGTFQPIKANSVTEHPMHNEQVIVKKQNVEQLLKHESIVSVGTTSMRTMESLYWYGCKLAENPNAVFFIEKLYPYESKNPLSKKESLTQVMEYMERNQLDVLPGNTEIFIFPGYRFRICKGLITNFHLPGSTLILLVAAFVGENWRNIYDFALNNDYRFLSYGDSSLLIPNSL